MITLVKYGALSGSEKYNVNVMSIDGLSTDTKPINKIDGMAIPNGSIYTEIDTGTTYMYDSANVTWYEVSIGGGRPEGGIVLVGETTTPLADEATTNPIAINGQSYTAQPNDAVIYGNKEFLFDGTKWHEFGDLSGLNADMIDDANTTNKFVTTSEKTTWNDKQNALNQTQMNAVNSGITTADVGQINTNKNNILITDITSNFVAVTGYTITNVSKVYRQGNHVFGHLWVNKNSGNFDNLTIEHCVTNSIDKCAYAYPQEGFFSNSNWKIENFGYVFITEDTKISVRPTVTNCNYAFIKIDYCCS